MSLMEALACGRTPVVMHVGANAEFLGQQLADLVVPAGDLNAFERVALEALCSPERRARAARAGRAHAIARYGFDRMVTEYERLYRGANPSELRTPGAAQGHSIPSD